MKEKIKMKRLLVIIISLISVSTLIFPQNININGRFSSSVYSFQRFDTAQASNNYLSAYQMLNLNLSRGNVALHSYMNLENDLATKIDGTPRMSFYNLFLEVRNLFDIADVKLGRQPLFNSVAGGIFDGINLDLRKDAYKFTAYYGGNVPAYEKLEVTNDLANNYVLGGKFTTVAVKNFQIDLSYINKNFKPEAYWATRLDANLNPIQVLIDNNSSQYQFASADVEYDLQDKLSINTRYDYDLNYNTTSKVELDGTYNPTEKLNLDFYYNFRAPEIRYNSIFSVFDYGNTQEVEVGAGYQLNKIFTLSGRYGDVVYQDANSQRVTVGINSNYGSFSYRKTFGYAGELDALTLYGAYSLLQGRVTPSLGLTYTKYKLSDSDAANNLTAVLAGINVRPLDVVSVDLQAQYMDNKIYQNDFRLFLKLNYWFNTNF